MARRESNPIQPGMRFGRLAVKAFAGRNTRCQSRWWCQCDCGTRLAVLGYNLKGRTTQSCGCLRKERTRERSITHGMKHTPEYACWEGMVQRCTKPTNWRYQDYGLRGICVCRRWQRSFLAFFVDMGPRPGPEHTLDRIDNDGSYTPENCRWATRVQQANNRRRNRRVAWRGETLTIAEWARRQGLPPGVLRDRIVELRWSLDDAMATPVKSRTGRERSHES